MTDASNLAEASAIRGRAPAHPLGFWAALALVVGNMIGSGVFLLPAALAPLGWNGVFGWLVTIPGALCLAYLFAALARSFPRAGGPYAFARAAFGPFAGFLVAWSYWVSLWVGNVAIATGVVAPLSTLMPSLAAAPALAACAVVWLLTLVNCMGMRAAGQMQIATTLLKFLPLAAVMLLAAGLMLVGGGVSPPPLRREEISLAGIGAAAALTLWAFLGLESATVPAEHVADAERTVPRATLIGTALTGVIYLFVCSAVALLLPPEEAARSGAPLGDFVARYWGAGAGAAIALFAAVSAFGALNGWILLQGEMPWAMARDGVFPSFLARRSARDTPVRAHLLSSAFLSLVVVANYSRSMVELFQFLALLATTASLIPYLACALAAIRLGGRSGLPALLAPVALLGALYSLSAIWGAGAEAFGWGVALLAFGVPVYLLMPRRPIAS
jgi:APA family basic amino acid/polyamine antiporter